MDGRVNSNQEGSSIGERFGIDEDGTVLDPQIISRVARLLRWYPRDWRERYGNEFEAMLSSSLSDGKGSLRLSFNVAREGIVTRLRSLNFVGNSAPPLERARASIMTIYLSMLGFLTSAAVLAFYEKGWRRAPALETLSRAGLVFGHSKAVRVFDNLMSSPTAHRLQMAANRSLSGRSSAWKAFERFQNRALDALHNSPAGQALHHAMINSHFASGAPVVLNDVGHGATVLAIALLVVALIHVVIAAARLRWRIDRRRLLVPLGLLSVSATVFAIGVFAFQSFQNIPLGQPGSEWQTVKSMFEGNFRFWPVVIFPLCATVSIALAAVGGVKLLRRVDFPPQMFRLQGSLAAVSAGCLCVVLLSTLSWVTALSQQAPGFLTSKDGGVFGTPFLPVFLVAIVVMIGTSWLVVSRSARCLRSIHTA
jgi:hypothetical protein